MKIRHKHRNCLNCGHLLDQVYNYCPMCGQENNDNNMSVGVLIHDFFSNYFSFDSRFAKSVRPFLFKPGFLTNRYNEGKRMTYAHPLRLYLVISLFYFFVCNLMVKDMLKDADRQISQAEASVRDMTFLSPEDRTELKNALSAGQMENVQRSLDGSSLSDLSQAINESLTARERKELYSLLSPVLLDSLALDTATEKSSRTVIPLTDREDGINTSVSVDSSSGLFIFKHFNELNDLQKNESLTEDQVIDSIAQGEQLSRTERYATRQGIRIMRADKAQLGSYVVKNLPIMMLLLIPLFAGILKLLYIRRGQLYINHIIHALHLHSFAYLVYGLTLIVTYFFIANEGISSFVNFIIFVLVTTYAYVSFLRVYKQGWFKTLVKFNIMGFLYINIIMAFFFLELAISILLY